MEEEEEEEAEPGEKGDGLGMEMVAEEKEEEA